MKTDGAIKLRRGEYRLAVEDYALPVILDARAIGCTTGEHLAAFLTAVGVEPPFEESWTKNSANRALLHLIKKGLIKWARHRGKRNPALEAKRIAEWDKAVRLCRIKEGYAGH